MSELTRTADVLTPDALAQHYLAKAPSLVRRTFANALAVLAWVGLPSTVLSTLSSLQLVIDAALWLVRQAGVLAPLLRLAGEGIHAIVSLWRSLTHPLWQALFGWVQIPMPDWAADALTLLILVILGYGRKAVHLFDQELLAGWYLSSVESGPDAPAGYVTIPRSFPYKDYFAETGDPLGPRQLADTERLWKKFRRRTLCQALARDTSRWPRYRPEALTAQFDRYWLAERNGRRFVRIQIAVALALACALGLDAAYRAGLF